MGIVWIGKIISLGINDLVVSYIVTTFIACQGVIIFILLVPLSKQVCMCIMIVSYNIDFIR